MEWVHIELVRILLSSCAYNSNTYLDLKNLLELYFKHLKSFIETRFHIYKRESISRVNLNIIGLIEIYTDNRNGHRIDTQVYAKWDKLLLVASSLHINWQDIYVEDTTIRMDSICCLHQSPNYPWHYINIDRKKIA